WTAIAFDSARSRVVLFGGTPVPPEAQVAVQSVLGDTWEHIDNAALSLASPQSPFELTLQPALATFADTVNAVSTTAPRPVPVQVTMAYTSRVLMGIRVPLPPTLIPAGLSTHTIGLPLQQIKESLTPNGFSPPGDITISAVAENITKTAVLRIVPG